MKRLLLALVSLFIASAAHAAPVTYGFYQGGYAENAFVSGYFRAEDLDNNGDITYFAEGRYPSGEVDCLFACEVSDYFMFFSGNSLVAPFVHRLPALAMEPGGDVDDVVGIFYVLGSSLLPTDFGGQGLIGSQNWSITPGGLIDNGVKWIVNYIPDAPNDTCDEHPLPPGANAPCGLITGGGSTGAGSTGTDELVRVFRIPEPAPLSLIGIALVGLAFIRRRHELRVDTHRHALKHMSLINRFRFSRLNLGVASFLFLAMFSTASFASVIYEYREVGSPTVIGTLEVASPPASASISWGTADPSDLIALFLNNAVFGLGSTNLLSVGGTLGPIEILSLDGSRLDGGEGFGIEFPTIFPTDPTDPTIDYTLAISFGPSSGEDFIGVAGLFTFPNGAMLISDLFMHGNWVLQVPEPGTLMLVAAGLVLLVITRRRRRSQ